MKYIPNIMLKNIVAIFGIGLAWWYHDFTALNIVVEFRYEAVQIPKYRSYLTPNEKQEAYRWSNKLIELIFRVAIFNII